jgi:hypothetical protein
MKPRAVFDNDRGLLICPTGNQYPIEPVWLAIKVPGRFTVPNRTDRVGTNHIPLAPKRSGNQQYL